MKLLDIHILLDKLTEQRRWDELLNVRGDREIIKVMNGIYPINIESFSYSVNSQMLKVLFHNRDFALNIDDLGVGMRTAFRFFMSILLTRNSAALAEEFDGYQYTESFPRFVKALFELSSQVNTQLFLTTHGHETIRVFVEQARKSPSIDLKIFQTDLSIDGIFRTACFSLDDAESLMAGGFDVRRTR
jgi:AAA15 family ATPase/GTPase